MRNVRYVLALSLFLTACSTKQKPTPENFLVSLNAYLPEHPVCLLDGTIRFPYETGDAEMTKQLDALTRAQLLAGTRASIIHVTRYTMTDAGKRSGARLCYGHREATSIVSSTPPADRDGFKKTDVTYQYKMMDAPTWAKSEEVQAAYPTLAKDMSGSATAMKTLALTGVGWTVPD
jgi:hypothetical protein